MNQLSPVKRELLSLLRSKQGWQAEPLISIPRRTDNSSGPLSFAQQRLWFLDQLDPGGFAYNVPWAVEIKGHLNLATLERVLNEIVRRHETLRTSFTVVRGVPVQSIVPTLKLTVAVIDLEHLSETDRDSEARSIAAAEAREPFVFERAPLLRVKVLRFDTEKYMMLLTMHHIISDGWSMGVLMREMTSLYQAFNEGQLSVLPELPVQYADFALWQRKLLQGEVLEDVLSYWKQQLNDLPDALVLPTDHPRPPVQTFRGAQCSFELSTELTESLKDLSRQEGVTLFMTLMAAWQTLLARYSGASEVIVGTPIANRRRVETEGLIGFFVNTMVMRTAVPPEITFNGLLKHVQEVALAAYAHQDVPFEKLVDELQPERELSHNPLFQVMFALQNAPMQEVRIEGLTWNATRVENYTARFDLTLNMVDTGSGLLGTLVYNTDLFEAATISRFTSHFETLLQGIVSAPETRIADLPLLPAAEEEQVLVEWNQTSSEYPRERCIHQLFEGVVAVRPAAVAVVAEETTLTYAELNGRANQLAHYLRERGVGAETLVGICVKRSAELVVGILGILKAGGSYVPLDPNYPLEHLTVILREGQVGVLLTAEDMEDKLLADQAQVILLDAEWELIAQQPETNVESGVSGANLAYVIYTSGSTGKPKGVMIPHSGLNNYLQWSIAAYEVATGKGSPVHSSIAFDLTITSLFPALLTGRTVVLVEEEAGVEGLGQTLLNEGGYSLVKITPAHLELLRHELPVEKLAGLTQALVVGGEALTWPNLAPWREHAPETRIINEYGPTETVVGCCVYEVNGTMGESGGVPIGRPIDNTQLYILDQQKRPVPIGVRGELHVGGAGVGRGYLNQPGQTAEKFIPDPFSGEAGGRLYVTGDLARYLADGRIELCGRLDGQVKIRGFRIEVGEIEAALNEHPAVQASLVTICEEAGDKRLVAYVVAFDAKTSELQSYLRSRLPEYMVPSAFVLLEEMPLTPNGKVDRRALPAPDWVRAELRASFVSPRSPVEEVLAGIWSRVLKVDTVGIDHNFFVLGGHSLLAAQAISEIREAFQIELPLRTLFEAPTVASLSEKVELAVKGGQGLLLPPIERVPRSEVLPLSFAQRRLWFIDQLDPGNAAYNIPLAMRLSGPLHVSALEQSLSEIIRRHESLRTTFPMRDGQPIQLINPPQPLTIAVTDLSQLPPSKREAAVVDLARNEARKTFSLLTGPLMRVSLLRLSEYQHVALLTMHHIVADGWSMGVLVKEVAMLYEAYRNGEKSPLEELPVQYADFGEWQRNWFSGELIETHLEYWREQLRGASVLQLPTDRPRPTVQAFRGATQTILIEQELTESLKQLSCREGVTLFMTLLAAFQTLMYRLSGQEDVLVGTGIANRNRKEVEGLIGCFINTLALRTDLSGDPSFCELLVRVREVTLGAYAHQDLPFEKIVDELEIERGLGHTPLFQVMFSLQNTPLETLELSGLTLEPFETTAGTSHVELILMMQEIDHGIRGTFEYNTDLFDENTITRISNHFTTLLEGVVAHPEWRLLDLPLMQVEETSAQLEDHEEQFSFQR